MAKITEPGDADHLPIPFEIRPWLKAATDPDIIFSLPDEGFTMAHTLYWIEVIGTVGDEVLFYARNLIQLFEADWQAAEVEGLFSGRFDKWGLGDMYPDSYLTLKRETHATSVWYTWEIDLNLARVFGATGDSWRVTFKVDDLEADQVRAFLQELAQDFASARSGHAPDAATVPDGYGTLPFARRINARAYDVISAEYGAGLFDDQIYRDAFENWVSRLPPGGHVLDVGCGHGAPVIATLLERGFQVTGIDVSDGMLARARAAYPTATFRNGLPTELTEQETYDGICSFFSLLHTDPIELRVALLRLQHALKPGGHLLIGSLLSNVHARQGPLYRFKGQWVWGCEFSADELEAALTAQDHFTIVKRTEDVRVWRPANSEPVEETEPVPSEPPVPEGVLRLPPLPPAFSSQSPTQWFTILAQRPI
jgi:SAM-dependent methyltransferase